MSAVAQRFSDARAQLIPDAGLHITNLEITDPVVLTEALRWTTGTRSFPAEPVDAIGCDFTEFVTEAVHLGARVLSVTSDSIGVTSLTTTVNALAQRAETASVGLVETAERASAKAIEISTAATNRAQTAASQIVTEAMRRFETESARTLDARVTAVSEQLDLMLATEKGPVVGLMKDVVNQAMSGAQETWHRLLTETLTRVSQSLDATDPQTPFGQLTRQLKDDQQRQSQDLAHRIDGLQELVVSTVREANTTAAIAAVQAASPAKGKPYEEAVGATVEAIACGLGASYTDTSDTVGELRGCKKGDGVIELLPLDCTGSAARVAIEYTTSGAARNWPRYLEEAERNRGAQASIGIVPARELVPGRELVAVLSSGRAVVAHNPDGDPAVLRATIQLLLVQAQRRLAAARGGDLDVADRKIAEARQHLVAMQEVLKAALGVRAGASKVVTGLEGLHATLSQLLEQAQVSLRTNSFRAVEAE